MANCLVLGANGLIGSSISRHLVREGHSVRAFDLFRGKDNLAGLAGKVERARGDYHKREDVGKALQGIGVVFHCIHTTVPRSSLEKPVFDVETNVLPAVNALMACVGAGVGKVVYLSSLAIYGIPERSVVKETDCLCPITPYGVSKLAIEKYIGHFNAVHGLDYAVLRPAATYGESQGLSPQSGVVANFVCSALSGKPLEIYGDGSAVRDLLYVDDLAAGAVKAAFAKTEHRVFQLGTGRGVSLNELAGIVKNAVGKELVVKHVQREHEVHDLVCDVSRARDELHWKAEVELEQGVKKCVEAFSREPGK